MINRLQYLGCGARWYRDKLGEVCAFCDTCGDVKEHQIFVVPETE